MKKIILSGALALIAFAGFSQSKNQSISLVLPSVMDLRITAQTDSYTFPDSSALQTGTKTGFASATLQVKSNSKWKLDMTVTDLTQMVDGEAEIIARNAIKYAVDGGTASSLANNTPEIPGVPESQPGAGDGTPLIPEVLGTNSIKTGGSKGGWGVSGHTLAVTFDVDLTAGEADPLSYTPGTYTGDVVYTLSAE